MDAERYARVRELFLAIDELPDEQQREFLASQCGDDQELFDEVMSLLDEHDIESAKIEGQAAKKPAFPSTNPAPADQRPVAGQPVTSRPVADRDPNSASPSTAAAPFMPGAHQAISPDAAADHDDSPRTRRKHGRQRIAAGKPTTRRSAGARPSADVTQQGAQRTHASPRYANDRPSPKQTPTTGIWQSKAKQHRRSNSGWLWLATILPTILIGWWTYAKVSESIRATTANELNSVADSVRISVIRYLNDQARLTETWSRSPELRASIIALVQSSAQDDSVESLRNSPHAQAIRKQLIDFSGRADIKYVVWDRTGKILASWLEDGADIGSNVAPDGAANLARAMLGETVLFGPAILTEDASGFRPETSGPVMAEIMPIRDDRGRVAATMLIRGFGMYQDFDEIFREASQAGGLDVYAINSAGVMVTDSPIALAALDDSINTVACQLRVSDPESSAVSNQLAPPIRRTQPLTYSAAGASSGTAGTKLAPYHNYAGVPVVGAWRWVDDWDLGIVVERSAQSARSTAGTVRLGFISLGLLLTITALVAASRIAKRTALAQAAVHPLSRYELVAELGSGGMGVVYRAKHGQLGRDTALKVLRGDRDNLEDRLRFDREAKLAASLSNPHTVTIYDYGRGDEGEAYCVMEFLKGITLYDVVARSGFQDYGRALFILRQICDSLGEAHKLGLVHRDIKPQNIMLSLDASVGDWAVVFDFGLAKPLQPDADSYQTAETIWAGTPMYMAPERYREPNIIDPRSDIYSVGCIAYFLLSGRPPFIECDPESLFALVLTEQPISIDVHRDDEVPDEIAQLVKRCMAKNVDDRFSTVDQLAVELDQLISAYPWTVEQARSWWRIHGEELE